MTQGLERAKGEREELQTALEITRTQTTTLLQEREALKNAQRDELQELESTFRKRLEVVEEQRSKLECVVQQQAENQSLLEEAKKQAALGLHLERQSNLELINKHQTEHQQLQEKFCAAISALEQQVHEREEERRSAHAERQHKALELQQFREEIASLQEENALLQETVRRECEERSELTATLSEARDQLMKLQRSATDPRGPQGPAQPSLPVLAPGHGHPPGRDTPAGRRIPASWQGASQPTPALPRLDKQRTRSISQGRQRVAVTMGRKDMC
ncbi:leucine-, glutamate- and lysine-rich protein 1-like [Electrophorus electricus]|uniref:leucine-, glutamate- and lysine-rich protein 1-like n=1 Tax=Electrophorus electricus TaxID=8005 RepID=UPI0015CFBDBC|nr:leucine-, glutamate- and lysine-rich protein 1-like [Electrophorus electricus]